MKCYPNHISPLKYNSQEAELYREKKLKNIKATFHYLKKLSKLSEISKKIVKNLRKEQFFIFCCSYKATELKFDSTFKIDSFNWKLNL